MNLDHEFDDFSCIAELDRRARAERMRWVVATTLWAMFLLALLANVIL